MTSRTILMCPVCREPFDNSIKKPLILLCGHSICQSCRNAILEVRVSGAICSCEEDAVDLCVNCQGSSCSVCRFPRAIQIEVCNTYLLENLNDIHHAFAEIDRDKWITYAELMKADRTVDNIKNSLEKCEAELKHLEATRNALGELQLYETNLGKVYCCRDCEEALLPCTRVHVCLNCSDKENLVFEGGIIMIINNDLIKKNLMCGNCSICNKCPKSLDGHKTKTYYKLQLLTDIEIEINRICVEYGKMDFDTRHPYLFDMRRKYQDSQNHNEKAKIRKDIENFISKSRRTIPTA